MKAKRAFRKENAELRPPPTMESKRQLATVKAVAFAVIYVYQCIGNEM